MSYQDKTIICVGCGKEFEFTASEQAFFESKGFTSEPKRCKECRQARRRKKPQGRDSSEYRSPAFHDSAPDHQGGWRSSRNRGRSSQGGRSEYRAPGFRDAHSGDGVYRSPAFRDQPTADTEYRSVAFQDRDLDDVRNEYRAPGFQDRAQEYRDERPMFSIVCSACGEKAMVPFLPEEVENPMCSECFRNQREAADVASVTESNIDPPETASSDQEPQGP